MIDDIKALLETDKKEMGRELYRNKFSSLSPDEFSVLTEEVATNIDTAIEIYNDGFGDLEAIDFLENCLSKNPEPDYFFNIGAIHYYQERYNAACRSLTSTIALAPTDSMPQAHFFLAISINDILGSTENIIAESHVEEIKNFVLNHLKKAKSLGFADASEALSQLFGR